MPPLPPPPDEKTTFERMPREPALAWNAFTVYRDMGPTRTLERTAQTLGRVSGYVRVLEEWSQRWKWGQRCLKWDAFVDAKARQAVLERMPQWEQQRQEYLRRSMEVASMIESRLMEQLTHPMTRERREEVNGREVVIIEPAKWNWQSLISGFKMVAELRAVIIAEGLNDSDEDHFDVETATREQLQERIKKLRGGRSRFTSLPD